MKLTRVNARLHLPEKPIEIDLTATIVLCRFQMYSAVDCGGYVRSRESIATGIEFHAWSPYNTNGRGSKRH